MLIRRVQYAQAYGEQIKTREGRRKIKKKPKPRRSIKIFFSFFKEGRKCGRNYDYEKEKNKQQEEEIEFILFSLCAFEKSLDLGCNFIIIFIKARNKAKCIVQNQRKRKNFLFRNEKINK